jgi:hypothetical protein
MQLDEYRKDDGFYKMSIQAKNSIDIAEKRFQEQLKKDFPVGTKLIVEIGTRLKVVVIGHSWTVGQIWVKNIKTQKRRKITLYNVICKCNDDWTHDNSGF